MFKKKFEYSDVTFHESQVKRRREKKNGLLQFSMNGPSITYCPSFILTAHPLYEGNSKSNGIFKISPQSLITLLFPSVSRFPVFEFSYGSAYSVVYVRHNFWKVYARWIAEELSTQHKAQMLDITSKYFAHYRNEGDGFLQKIVTVDET